MKKLKAFIMVLVFVGGGYMLVEVNFNEEIPAYDRREWSHWTQKNCLTTRERVLIRDAKEVLLSADGCEVLDGVWIGPYSGERIEDPSGVHIDHFIPLKRAHEAGGYKWDKERKKKYANYLENDYHLLAVKAQENTRKGAKGPDEYMPPFEPYRCEYAQNWLLISQEWNLLVSESELLVINEACEQ